MDGPLAEGGGGGGGGDLLIGLGSNTIFEIAKTTLGHAYKACRNVPRTGPPEAMYAALKRLNKVKRLVDASGVSDGQLRGAYARDPQQLQRLLQEISKACDEFIRITDRYIDINAPDSSVPIPFGPETSSQAPLEQNRALPMKPPRETDGAGESSESENVEGTLTETVILAFKEFSLGSKQAITGAVRYFEWDVLGFDAKSFYAACQQLESAIDDLCKFDRGFDLEIHERSMLEARVMGCSPELRKAFEGLTDRLKALSVHRRLGDMNSGIDDASPPCDEDGVELTDSFMVPQGSYELSESDEMKVEGSNGSHFITTMSHDDLTPGGVSMRSRVLVEVCRVSDKERSWRRLALVCQIHGKTRAYPGMPTLQVLARIKGASLGRNETVLQLIYRFPDSIDASPSSPPPTVRTLKSYLESEQIDAGPPLDARLRLACKLVSFVFRYHAMGWVHKHICLANILLFENSSSSDATDDGLSRRPDFLAHAFVVGFDYARRAGRKGAEQSEKMGPGVQENEKRFRHPHYRSGQQPFRQRFDLYSLGIVLWEIATWGWIPRRDLFEMDNPPTRAQLRAELQHVEFYCGSRFANVIEGCLIGLFKSSLLGTDCLLNDVEESEGNLLVFEAAILEELETLTVKFASLS